MSAQVSDLTSARVLADSLNPVGIRLTTVEVTLPRPVLAELNTHRDFSRNSASSRAIPVAKMIERVEQTPFIPRRFPKNQKGMQSAAWWVQGDPEYGDCVREWLRARDRAVEAARHFVDMGIHKQITNRLLEPFLWHKALISSTRWDNFFRQRCHPDAQDEIRYAAEAIQQALDASEPQQLKKGEWHLPLVGFEGDEDLPFDDLVRVSAARCARVSYLTHDGRRDVGADMDLYIKLAESEPQHLSPTEHPAQAQGGKTGSGNFNGFRQARWFLENDKSFDWQTPKRARKKKVMPPSNSNYGIVFNPGPGLSNFVMLNNNLYPYTVGATTASNPYFITGV